MIGKYFNVVGILYYERKLVEKSKLPPKYFNPIDIKIEKKHFKHLKKKEKEYFFNEVGKFDDSSIRKRNIIGAMELNKSSTINWIKSIDPDVILDYGSGILQKQFLKVAPPWVINLHGGISPYYKGSSTLFWPFYFQQPELAGITYHLIDLRIDHGNILQHFRPSIQIDDTIHDIGCRAIKDGSLVGVRLLKKLEQKGTLDTFPQKKTGKLFLEKDYKPSHIKTLYDLWEGGIIKHYLNNKEIFDKKYNFIDQLGDDDFGIK